MKPLSTRKMSLMLVTCMLFAAVLSACSPAQPAPAAPAAAQPAAKDFKVAALFSSKIAGSAWDENAYTGLKEIEKETGASIAFTENVQIPDIENTLSDYADQGYKLIIGNGFEYGDPMKAVAARYPNTTFVAITGAVSDTNVASLDYAQHELGYVTGVVAGLMTKTNKIGVVAATNTPNIIRYVEAAKLGAKSVNPNAAMSVVFINSWSDVQKGSEAAKAMVDNGVDILMHKANVVGQGVIQVAQQAGVYAIGDGSDQNSLAPKTVLTSGLASTPAMMVLVAKSVQEGTFKGGALAPGFKDGVLSLAPYYGLVPDDKAAQVDKVIEEIKSGALVVPEITQSTP